MAGLARWFEPRQPFAALPDLLPVWTGSYIPPQLAVERWGHGSVWTAVVGCPDADTRRGLVAQVRREPPGGMFETEADADSLELPLVFWGFVIPGAVIRMGRSGRFIDRATGIDTIGFGSEEEELNLEAAVVGMAGAGPDPEISRDALLQFLSRRAARRLPGVGGSDTYDAVLDQAFELAGLGAVSAAGAWPVWPSNA